MAKKAKRKQRLVKRQAPTPQPEVTQAPVETTATPEAASKTVLPASTDAFQIDKVHPDNAPYVGVSGHSLRGARRHTLVFYKGYKNVQFLAFDSAGMSIQRMTIEDFEKEYGVLVNYPVKRAMDHFTRAAADFGATAGVKAALEQLRNGTSKEVDEEAILASEDTSQPQGETDMAKKAAKAKGKKVTNGAAKKERGVGLGAFIKELVMKGTLTDAAIVEKAKEKFPKNKITATYPSWYRSKMNKDGVKGVPEAIREGKKD